MRPLDFPLLLDENIDQAVASALRSQGRNVESVWSRGLSGIVYVRPGHIDPAFVMETLDAVAACEVEPEPPFIVVADRRGAGVRIRVRELAKTSAG